MITDKQRHIYEFIKEKGKVRKSEIVERFSHWYRWNDYKYIGDILHRMVKNGYIERTENFGYYRVVNEGKVRKQTEQHIYNLKLDLQ